MNRDEAVKKIAKAGGLSLFYAEDLYDSIIPKPTVPQFVADWYEENKDDFEYNLYRLCIDFREKKLRANLRGWFGTDVNKPIEMLVKMKLYGYEVEKEKLYTVEIPNPNEPDFVHIVLTKNEFNQIMITSVCDDDNWRTIQSYQLTESEIKKDFDWTFRWAKEVE